MKEGESVDEYFARTLAIANKMKIHGESIGQFLIIWVCYLGINLLGIGLHSYGSFTPN